MGSVMLVLMRWMSLNPYDVDVHGSERTGAQPCRPDSLQTTFRLPFHRDQIICYLKYLQPLIRPSRSYENGHFVWVYSGTRRDCCKRFWRSLRKKEKKKGYPATISHNSQRVVLAVESPESYTHG